MSCNKHCRVYGSISRRFRTGDSYLTRGIVLSKISDVERLRQHRHSILPPPLFQYSVLVHMISDSLPPFFCFANIVPDIPVV